MRSRARITKTHPAGKGHVVSTIVGGHHGYRRKPCEQCPWRKDLPIGAFPAEAFRISANTAYDVSTHLFACHMSGNEKPATCAGFLLRNAANNIGARIAKMRGDIDMAEVSTDSPLYESYRAMAEANGVPKDDPALRLCRSDNEFARWHGRRGRL